MSVLTTPVPAAASIAAAHPLWLRMSHWLNAMAAFVLVASGWRIYDAAPLYAGVVFPKGVTLGGWLGGALQWHFAAMWLLAFNGVVYLALNVATGRFARRLLPPNAAAIGRDFGLALRRRLAHDRGDYNAVQRAAYLFVLADLSLLVLSGLVLWKSVQFPLLRELIGGYETARRVHFFAMAALVLFIAVHLAMVVLVPQSLRSMIGAGDER